MEKIDRFGVLQQKTFFKNLRHAGVNFFASRPHFRSMSFVGLALAVVQIGNTAQAEPRSIPIRIGSQPRSIIMDADGNFWSTLSNSSEVVRITPQGMVTSFATPTPSNPVGITAGPDGNIWFTEGATGKIAFITPAGAITEIRFSPSDAAAGITAGPDGNIWFCDESGNSVWRCDVSTRKLTRFPLPTPNAWPGEITTGADGNLWFTERPVDKVGRIAPTGMITEIENLSSPGSITTGPDRNIWFASSIAPVVGRITPTGSVTLFPTPEVPYQIRCGQGNVLLLTEPKANRIATITTSGIVTESPAILRSAPTGITSGVDRRVWFLGSGTDRIYSDVAPENSMARQAVRASSTPTAPSGLRITVTGN
jgi:virginiamycin B lyase